MKLNRYEQAGAIFTESLSNLQDIRKKAAIVSNPTIVNSPLGKAMSFDGGDDYIDFGNNGNVANIGSTDFTLSIWIKTSDAVNKQKIIRKEGIDPRFYLRVVGGNLHALVDDGSTIIQIGGDASTVVADGEWHHVVGTFNVSDTMQLYIDGVWKIQSASIAGLGTLKNNNNLQISDASNTFNGEIKDVTIFNRLLTLTEISNIYNNKAFDYSRIIWNDYNIDGTTLTYSPLNSTQKTNIKNNLKSDGSTSLGLTQLQLDDFGEGNKW